MKNKNARAARLWRPADLLLPIAFLIAASLGRGGLSLRLYIAAFTAKLCSLASSEALRSAFARQPSMRYVQGSALLALLLQLPGAAVAAILLRCAFRYSVAFPLIICGTLLNIEHVFYEYLYALGDSRSATLCRSITSLLTLAGILLSAPPDWRTSLVPSVEHAWLLGATALSALVGLTIGLSMGGVFKPRLNLEVIRSAPLTLLQAALYPALALSALLLISPIPAPAPPLFAGLALYEPCRTPFRRSPSEAAPLNRALLIAVLVASICATFCRFIFPVNATIEIVASCFTIILAAQCAFALFGNFSRREPDAT